jgi:hypothetical protein
LDPPDRPRRPRRYRWLCHRLVGTDRFTEWEPAELVAACEYPPSHENLPRVVVHTYALLGTDERICFPPELARDVMLGPWITPPDQDIDLNQQLAMARSIADLWRDASR